MRKFAISDIHGCPKTLQTLVEKQLQLTKGDKLFLLGDYVNRGPDSFGVMDLVMQWQAAGYQLTCLRGNHEDRLDRAFKEGFYPLEDKYSNFIESLKIFHQEDNYIMVHAGLNFHAENPMEDQYAMRWIRDWEEDSDEEWLGGRKVVYGHKRKKRNEIQSFVQFQTPYLGIDNGCCMNDSVECEGHLCALQLGNEKLTFQKNIDMNPGTGEESWNYLFAYMA
ncbi:MAG: metallophosphoesterase [Bacteroidia bacterium]|nr:metallophosphoesterase [Bacteroidia bacterium]